jgi:hypothetical protein
MGKGRNDNAEALLNVHYIPGTIFIIHEVGIFKNFIFSRKNGNTVS